MLEKSAVYLYYALVLFAHFLLIVPNQHVESAILLTCFLALLLSQVAAARSRLPIAFPAGLLPGSLLLLLLVLQIVPLPPAWLELVAPGSADIYKGTIWLIAPHAWMTASINPQSTLHQFFKLAAMLAFYVLSTQMLLNPMRSYRTINCLSIAVLIASAIYLGRAVILECLPVPAEHLAGLLSESVPALLLVVAPLIYAGTRVSPFRSIRWQDCPTTGQVRRMVAWFRGNLRHYFFHAIIFLIVYTVLYSGSLLTLSAFFWLCLGWWVFLQIRRSSSSRQVKLAGLVLLVLVSAYIVAWSGLPAQKLWQPEEGRQLNPLLADRTDITIPSVALSLIGRGAGSGPASAPAGVSSGQTVDQQLAGFWQVLQETGLTGLLLVACFILWHLRNAAQNWQRRSSRLDKYLLAGALTGLAGYLFLSVADPFGEFILPGIFLFLISAMLAAAPRKRVMIKSGIIIGKSLCILLLFMLYWGGDLYAAWCWGRSAGEAGERSQGHAVDIVAINSLSGWSPFEPRYRSAALEHYIRNYELSAALSQVESLLKVAPADGRSLLLAGLAVELAGAPDKADRLMQASQQYGGLSGDELDFWVNWLLSRGLQRQALKLSYYALLNSPYHTGRVLAIFSLYQIPYDEMFSAVPQSSVSYWLFANHLSVAGRIDLADHYAGEAVRLASREDYPDIRIFHFALAHFQGQGHRREETFHLVRIAQEVFPNDTELTLLAARIYEQSGIGYRAVEEYRRVLLLDPGNETARQKLTLLSN